MPTIHPIGVVTLDGARLFLNACEAWMDLGKDEGVDEEAFSFVTGSASDTAEDILKQYGGLTREDSCRWALYGWPAESELEFEKLLANWAGYTEKLRVRIKFLVEQLINRQRAINEFNQRE